MMSLETWIAKYAPPLRKRAARLEMVEWCLAKWLGLRPAALLKHGVALGHGEVAAPEVLAVDWPYRDEENSFDIGWHCPLCVGRYGCKGCPLFVVRGGECNEPIGDEGLAPFGVMSTESNPEPMIGWLRKARKMLQEKKK